MLTEDQLIDKLQRAHSALCLQEKQLQADKRKVWEMIQEHNRSSEERERFMAEARKRKDQWALFAHAALHDAEVRLGERQRAQVRVV